MRHVLENPPEQDTTEAQRTIRKWFERDTAAFLKELDRMERGWREECAKRRAGRGQPPAEGPPTAASSEAPIKDEGMERAMGLCREVLKRLAKEAEEKSAGQGPEGAGPSRPRGG
jgi:hypothetical protein